MTAVHPRLQDTQSKSEPVLPGPDPELMTNSEGDKKALRCAKEIARRDLAAAPSPHR